MLKYGDYLSENLVQIATEEPSSQSAEEAKRLGLTYLGFGRYSDETGQVAYVVDRGRLVPFKHKELLQKSAEKATNGTMNDPEQVAALQKDMNLSRRVRTKDMKVLTNTAKEAEKTNSQLQKAYTPNNYAPEEIGALQSYTDGLSGQINNYLYKGFNGSEDPETAQAIQNSIVSLDNMLSRSQTPFPLIVYTGLSTRYDPNNFKAGKDYVFRGYSSCTLDYGTALDVYGQTGQQAPKCLLQIDIQQGQKALYVDSLTGTTNDKEVLLPRGSKVKILSGPHTVGEDILQAGDVALFHCQLVQDI